MKNCLVGQSGGPTAAINASLAGTIAGVRLSTNYDIIYGLKHGMEGLFKDDIVNLTEIFPDEESLIPLIKSPSMYLGSCRYKLPEMDEDEKIYEKVFEYFRVHEIKAFFYIGGNDSMDTVKKLSEYAKAKNINDVYIIGIPKTIDNDLILTDHTPGFGSAAKYVAGSIREIEIDNSIYAVKSVNIAEIMGRDAGWLTASSVLAREDKDSAPHLIYLPEVPFSKEKFIEDVKRQLEIRDHVVVAVSEGIRDENGAYISVDPDKKDAFGHEILAGAGKNLADLVSEKIGVKTRFIEFNILQRAASHMASEVDLKEAYKQGRNAVSLSEMFRTGIMVNITRKDTEDGSYEVEYGAVPVCDIANKVKNVPLEWITEDGCDVTEELIEYVKPLVKGEVETIYKDGLPVYLKPLP
ncbi:MAG: 6-phosphofructokinase [Lachnospiraceae bacterium]|nr:6-phosphofructokinase [Lachnospiraceae bacterium]